MALLARRDMMVADLMVEHVSQGRGPITVLNRVMSANLSQGGMGPFFRSRGFWGICGYKVFIASTPKSTPHLSVSHSFPVRAGT